MDTMTIHEQIKRSDSILFKGNEILVVLDIDPISKGHALILPQKSYLDIDEIPTHTLRKIFKAARIS